MIIDSSIRWFTRAIGAAFIAGAVATIIVPIGPESLVGTDRATYMMAGVSTGVAFFFIGSVLHSFSDVLRRLAVTAGDRRAGGYVESGNMNLRYEKLRKLVAMRRVKLSLHVASVTLVVSGFVVGAATCPNTQTRMWGFNIAVMLSLVGFVLGLYVMTLEYLRTVIQRIDEIEGRGSLR